MRPSRIQRMKSGTVSRIQMLRGEAAAPKQKTEQRRAPTRAFLMRFRKDALIAQVHEIDPGRTVDDLTKRQLADLLLDLSEMGEE